MVNIVVFFILFFLPSSVFAEIVGEQVISHSVSLLIGSIACSMMLLGYLMNKF